MAVVKPPCPTHRLDLIVLAMIGAGLITILLAIIGGLFLAQGSAALPNWAENVLISIASMAGLKVGDVLSALVALATGRQVETLGRQLADSQPTRPGPAPRDAAAGAKQAADAAGDVADDLEQQAETK